jgi:hypothetical protein
MTPDKFGYEIAPLRELARAKLIEKFGEKIIETLQTLKLLTKDVSAKPLAERHKYLLTQPIPKYRVVKFLWYHFNIRRQMVY